jgi:ADP-ribosylglycohydrolase
VHDVLDMREMLRDEIIQLRESGHVLDDLATSAGAIDAASDVEVRGRLAELEAAPMAAGWPYHEPSQLEAIEGEQPAAPEPAQLSLDESALHGRILGAWLGRCAGCMLGKPVESWQRSQIREYLQHRRAYPIRDYLPPAEPGPHDHPPLHPSWAETTLGRIGGVARDDDIDYTILALHILDTYGPGFTTADVATEWLRRFPFAQLYTAERAAYRNLILGLRPPATAVHVNPYREWIGAQIRADAFGYVSPGDPAHAARLAYKDARLSHTANGIFGAMWSAALVAASFAERSMGDALRSALAAVPARSRLAEALRGVADLRARDLDWEAARDAIEERHGALSPVHTINNAAVVAAALLWGEGDFTRTIGLAVQGGWDTDCNGATAGSAFGAMHGVHALPAHWTAPLEDRIRTALFGFDGARPSALAERTLRVALRPMG